MNRGYLSALAKPRAIEEVSFQALVDRRVQEANGRFTAAGIDYDVGGLDTDPVKINLEVDATEDMLTRARINDAICSTLLAYATGPDLDHVAGDHGVTRIVGEDDDRLALRTFLHNHDRNSAGSEPHYRFRAMTASLRVKDAVVYMIGRDPTIRIAVLAADNEGIPDAGLLELVRESVDLGMINDPLLVEPAVRQVTAVSADVWLLPDAPAGTIDAMSSGLRAAWEADGRLGRDLAPSWMTGHLQQPGVQRIENLTPANPIAVPFNRYVALGVVTLTLCGRSY